MPSGKDTFIQKDERRKMENRKNSIQKEHERLLDDSSTDTFTKLELSKALLENIDEFVIDLITTRREVNSEIRKLEKQLTDEKEK